MPIYEYYCADCHTLFSFLARSTSNQAEPACPRCKRQPLEKKLSRFAISKGRGESPSPSELGGGLDDDRMESAMMSMADKLESIDDQDPRAMATAMRELFQASGMEPNEAIQEAMRRMEAGADPDQIEEELGAELDASDLADFSANSAGKGLGSRRLEPPNVDPGLYDL